MRRALKNIIIIFMLAISAVVALPQKTTEAAALAPDQLVYSTDSRIYVTDASLTASTMIFEETSNLQIDQGVIVSPDRRFIYFARDVAYNTASTGLYRMNVDGTNITDLGYLFTDGAPFNAEQISPDGKKLVIRHSGANRIIDTNTGAVLSTIPFATGIYGQREVTWFDDDELLVTYYTTASTQCHTRIARVAINGTSFVPLTPDNSGLSNCGRIETPVASKNGVVAYRVINAENRTEVYTAAPDGSGVTLAYESPAWTLPSNGQIRYGTIDDHAWSPDGARLVLSYYHYSSVSGQTGPTLGVLDLSTQSITSSRRISDASGWMDLSWGAW